MLIVDVLEWTKSTAPLRTHNIDINIKARQGQHTNNAV